MIRQVRRLSKLSYGQDGLLPSIDSWALPGKAIDRKTSLRLVGASRFTQHILNREHERAWYEIEPQIERDPRFLHNFKASACSKFLALLPDGSVNSEYHWPKAWKFANAMKESGIEFTSQDYTCLINLSFKAHDYLALKDIWEELQIRRPDLLNDVHLWNAYIQASCQAYPLFWPGPNSPLRLKEEEAPPLMGDVVELLKKMELTGVAANARTYELAMMAFGRNGRLDTAQSIVERAWLENKPEESSILYPSVSTLSSIIEAWAVNNKIEEGIDVMLKVQKLYQIPLDSAMALHTWIRILRLVIVNTKPSGIYSRELFEQVWQLAETHNVKPNLGMWSIRMEYLENINQFDKIIADIPKIMGTILPTYLDESRKIRCSESALTRAVKGYTNTGRALEALTLLDTWAKEGLDLRVELQEYVKRRSGITFEQLAMFKEDDDNDNWF